MRCTRGSGRGSGPAMPRSSAPCRQGAGRRCGRLRRASRASSSFCRQRRSRSTSRVLAHPSSPSGWRPSSRRWRGLRMSLRHTPDSARWPLNPSPPRLARRWSARSCQGSGRSAPRSRWNGARTRRARPSAPRLGHPWASDRSSRRGRQVLSLGGRIVRDCDPRGAFRSGGCKRGGRGAQQTSRRTSRPRWRRRRAWGIRTSETSWRSCPTRRTRGSSDRVTPRRLTRLRWRRARGSEPSCPRRAAARGDARISR
mmetsp:Transcript_63005/g.150265  ORF Transcript_63005/g.150265 Transcript_63005/m.150265 type:complete len:255 (+) Transcript_63005:415-1179(+)